MKSKIHEYQKKAIVMNISKKVILGCMVLFLSLQSCVKKVDVIAEKPFSDLSIYNLPSKWTNQNGENLEMKDLKGKVLVMVMIYTSCKSACPRLVADMRNIEKRLPENIKENVKLDEIGDMVNALPVFQELKNVYPNAATWSSSVWQIGSVVGPAVAGFSITYIGVHWSMCAILACSIFALLLLTQISKKPILNPKIGEPVMESLKEGIKFVYTNKSILGALTLDMVAVLFGGAVALLPIFAQDILKVGPEGFGVLRAAPAVGALLTMFVSAHLPFYKNAGIKLLAAIFGFGICIIVFGLSTWFWLSVFALFMSGVTDGISVVIRQTILQLKTPDSMRGRVAAVNSIFVGSSNELGAFESGLTAKLMGTVTAVVFGGSMTLLIVVFTGIKLPGFRTLDLQKDLEEHENHK